MPPPFEKYLFEELAQGIVAAVDVLAAGGFAGVAVGLERRRDRVHVARCQRALVLGHDTLRAQIRIALQHGGAVQMAARERPDAVVDPELCESPVGLAVGDDRDRNVHSPRLTLEVENHFLESPRLHEHMVDRVERHVVVREPRAQLADVRLERPHADHPSAPGVVQDRLAGERPDQSLMLTGHQAVVVGHLVEPLQLPLLPQSLQHRTETARVSTASVKRLTDRRGSRSRIS